MWVTNMFIGWLLLMIFAVAWVLLMRKWNIRQDLTVEYLQRQNQLMEQYIQVTERIAASLERLENKAAGAG
jgi:hypothetical protein